METLKRCRKCGIEKPLDEIQKDKRKKDGRSTICRACANRLRNNYRKPLSKEEKRIKNKRYRAAHREEILRQRREWRTAHGEEVRLAERIYRETHREQILERRRLREEYKPRIYKPRIRKPLSEEGRKRKSERMRAWRAAHPEQRKLKRKESKARRRAQARSVHIEKVDFKAIWNRDAGICHICGLPVVYGEHHFDHVIPLSRGGEHSNNNIRVAHAKCNLKKGARLPSSAVAVQPALL